MTFYRFLRFLDQLIAFTFKSSRYTLWYTSYTVNGVVRLRPHSENPICILLYSPVVYITYREEFFVM